jgi:hypothetical protein
MANTIALRGIAPVASGLNQHVHQHPGDPDLLIKTLRPDKAEQRFLRKRGIPVKRRHGIYTGWFRELNEYVALRARLPGPHPDFLQHLHGFVETDLGLGLVVGKVKDRSGALAPTLGQAVLERGLTAELRAQVAALRDLLNRYDVVTNDLTKSNILCGWSEALGDHLVIIEGLGDHSFIPLATWSRRVNRRGNDRHFHRIMTKLELVDRVHRERQQA